jgi:hypothetical protein
MFTSVRTLDFLEAGLRSVDNSEFGKSFPNSKPYNQMRGFSEMRKPRASAGAARVV